MKICSSKDIKVITAIMAATMLLGGCQAASVPAKKKNSSKPVKNDPTVKTELNLNKVSETEYDKDEMDEAYRRYCFDLFSQTVRDYGDNSNIMISPASIMIALDMVAAGAKEDSLKQLTDLFAAGQGPLTQQAYAAALMDKLNASKDVKFSCANAVWNNSILLGDAVNLEYVDYLKNTFLAEYTLTEFDSETPGEINDWIYENTDHMIKNAIDKLNPDTVMVLVNAISFDGKWAEGYEDYQIQDGEFTKADGSTQNAIYLNDTTSTYFETEKATGFMKYYEGGKYAFLAILPSDETISANDFVNDFSADDYERFIESATGEYDVYSKMPEFKYDFGYLMNDTISNLGCRDIFIEGKADLSGIAGAPGNLYVSKVLHKTHIEVDRSGTKAAAATVVMVDCESACFIAKEYKTVNCDRPFVYAIVDCDTMAPVFVGTVNEV